MVKVAKENKKERKHGGIQRVGRAPNLERDKKENGPTLFIAVALGPEDVDNVLCRIEAKIAACEREIDS